MYTPINFTGSHRLPTALPGAAHAFAFRADKILAIANPDESFALPTMDTLLGVGIAGTPHFLGMLGDVSCIAVNLADEVPEPSGMRFVGLRSLFFKVPEPLLAIAARAFQVVDWDRGHRHCGRCGTPTRDRADERAKECPACGQIAYPRVSPAMMTLVTRGRDILLARAHRFAPGMFSALAGFVEPGETIEDCIHREVREEVGVEVGEPVYFASQSWAFPHSLMIAYTAEYAGGELKLEDAEIAEARWFASDALPYLPPSVSIARRLIDATATRLRQLPVAG